MTKLKLKLKKNGQLELKEGDLFRYVTCTNDVFVERIDGVYWGIYAICSGKNKETGRSEYVLINLHNNIVIDRGNFISFAEDCFNVEREGIGLYSQYYLSLQERKNEYTQARQINKLTN